jgi:glutamate transport system permease protein
MTAPVLADALGPRGRRRVAVASAVASAVLALVVLAAVRRLQAKGQLEARLWEPFTDWKVWRFLLLTGLKNTLRVAGAAMALALPLGVVLALLRLSRRRVLRWSAGAFIEFFRSMPLLLLILFSALALPKYGVRLSIFGYLVLALVVYNGAVLGEIFRAGILSLDRGQSEAAEAVGLTYSQVMTLVVLPQAFRRMIPVTVSQLVTLLKDTSLGFVIGFEELLRTANSTGEYYRNHLQALTIAALLYIAVNFTLSRLAHRLEIRQRRRLRAGSVSVAGLEDLAMVDAAGRGDAPR